jgi:hypothetical protein
MSLNFVRACALANGVTVFFDDFSSHIPEPDFFWPSVSNQDIIQTLTASPSMVFASLNTTSPHRVPLASDPTTGSARAPANHNSPMAFQHPDPAAAFAHSLGTHHPSGLGQAVVQRVPSSTLRTSGAMYVHSQGHSTRRRLTSIHQVGQVCLSYMPGLWRAV